MGETTTGLGCWKAGWCLPRVEMLTHVCVSYLINWIELPFLVCQLSMQGKFDECFNGTQSLSLERKLLFAIWLTPGFMLTSFQATGPRTATTNKLVRVLASKHCWFFNKCCLQKAERIRSLHLLKQMTQKYTFLSTALSFMTKTGWQYKQDVTQLSKTLYQTPFDAWV